METSPERTKVPAPALLAAGRGTPVPVRTTSVVIWLSLWIDPEAFVDKDQSRVVGLRSNQHLAFVSGQSRCVGAHLATRSTARPGKQGGSFRGFFDRTAAKGNQSKRSTQMLSLKIDASLDVAGNRRVADTFVLALGVTALLSNTD